jgi:hypothetical protein
MEETAPCERAGDGITEEDVGGKGGGVEGGGGEGGGRGDTGGGEVGGGGGGGRVAIFFSIFLSPIACKLLETKDQTELHRPL